MNTSSNKNTTVADKTANQDRIWYQAALGSTIVAGAFSLAVIILLARQSFYGNFSELLEPPDIKAEKLLLMDNPTDETLKEKIRLRDYELRKNFYQRQNFIQHGAYILTVALLVFFVGLKYTLAYRKRPHLPPVEVDTSAVIQTTYRRSFPGVIILGMILAAAGVILLLSRNYISDKKFQSALAELQQVQKDAEAKAQQAITKSPAPTFPTWQEISRNWPRFRGPSGSGISAFTNIPVKWDGKTNENIRWKSKVPLSGNSSPVVWGKRIFLTGATAKKRQVYCYDADNGKLLWQKDVVNPPPGKEIPKNPDAPKTAEVTEQTGFAAPTTVTDGQRVFAIFANGDIACFDYNGNKIWGRSLGVPESIYGYATSLALYRNLLLVQYDQGMSDEGKSRLWAFDALTGKIAWQRKRMVANSWASPIIIDYDAAPQLITLADPCAIAYNPLNGKTIWWADCLYGDVAPSPVYNHGLVMAVKPNEEMSALRVDGKGNVTSSHIAWTTDEVIPDTASPLATDKLVLLVSGGLIACLDIQDGSMLWQHEYDAMFHTSPSLVGDKIYLFSEKGVGYILKADRKFAELGKNELGEKIFASPAFQDGRMYLRGKQNLYCIENSSAE